MTVYRDKARDRWRYDFRLDGIRHAAYAVDPKTGEPAKSKRQALAAEAAERTRLAKPVCTARPGHYTLAEALAYYAEHVGRHRDSWPDIRLHIRELLERLGPTASVDALMPAEIDAYIAWARLQPRRFHMVQARQIAADPDRRRKPERINKYLNTLRAALRLVQAKQLVQRIPHVPRLDPGAESPNPVQADDLARILEAAAPHLRAIIELAAMTGMRMAEILGLTWGRVDFGRAAIRLRAADTKSDTGREVLLNAVAMATLTRLREPVVLMLSPPQALPIPPVVPADWPVIVYRGRAVVSVRNAWVAVLRKVGLVDADGRPLYRLHDLRAAYCSMLAQAGTDVTVIKELVGHASVTTTMRYTRAFQPHMRAAVEKIAAELLAGTSTPASHTEPTAQPKAKVVGQKKKSKSIG